jgi:uncharacterized membrane protein
VKIEAIERIQAAADKAAQGVDAVVTAASSGGKAAPPAELASGLVKAKADSLAWAMSFPRKSCTELYRSKWASLVLVTVVVLGGLVFGGIQLAASTQLASRALALEERALGDTATLRILVQARPTGDAAGSRTDLALENGKASVQTSMVGIAVLVISLAFFFLYLRFVFPKDAPDTGKPPAPGGGQTA